MALGGVWRNWRSVAQTLATGTWRGRRFRVRLLGQILGFALLAGFVGLRVWDPVPTQMVRHEIMDLFQVVWPRTETTGEVVIVDLDDQSLSRYGQWPWPRVLLAFLVERLFGMGADVVAFDVVFPEPDRLSPPNLATQLDGLSAAMRSDLASLPDHDAIFAETIARNRVVLGQPALHQTRQAGGQDRGSAGTVVELGGDPRPFLQRYAGLVRNLPVLETAASGIGTVTIALEQDGVARRVPLALAVDGQLLPALSIEALRVRADEPSLVIRTGQQGVEAFAVGGHAIPTDRQGRIWVRYGRPGSIPYVSAGDVLSGLLDPAAIEGRIVLIGSTAAGLFDIKRTPLSPATPGVEVHAHLLETVLSGTYLRRPAVVEGAEMVAMIASSLLVIVLVPSFGALATLGIGGILMAALVFVSWYLFAQHLVLMDVSFAAFASLAIYGTITYIKYMTEEQERKAVRSAFAQYLPAAVVDRLASHPEQLRLGGEGRDVSVLFADVRGFTTMAETLDPEQLATLVNQVLSAMTGAVLEHGGTVDKYIGDCVMALWNAPLDDADHARRACRAALAVVQAVDLLNEQLAAVSSDGERLHLGVGVGINTGRAAVGNFGSTYRFDYTALGDTVNLAARLETQTRVYACPVIIGESTQAAVPDFATLELDVVQVKGRRGASTIFGVVGDEQLAASTSFIRLREAHQELLAAIAAGDASTARRALGEARLAGGVFGLEALYDVYASRIEAAPAPVDSL